MKKSLKNLELKKQTISRLEQNTVRGGGGPFQSQFAYCESIVQANTQIPCHIK
ncbi:hypothetical protein [Aquimarina sp. 2201CG14-23]|uniref:hypothetical protein n=1 Tax=Aquimarina mycalae TaxID=3040073 RepID=UPI0024781DBF|nr:hypothetical protein [Aquimarina sp. 2201CG14-23]MDH7447396.1 hypothetical protein [Aquimarina sp. 2201CG14-23]